MISNYNLSGLKNLINYFAAFLFLLLGITSFFELTNKADLPFSYEYKNGFIRTAGNDSAFHNLKISEVNSVKVNSIFKIEFLLDSKKPDDSAGVVFLTEDNFPLSMNFKLVPYYKSNGFIIISILIGLIFILSALFVYHKKPGDSSAKSLFWVLTIIALAVITPPGTYSPKGNILGYIVRIYHLISYVAVSFSFFHFILIISRNKPVTKKFLFPFYSLGILLCLSLCIAFFYSASDFNLNWLKVFENLRLTAEIFLMISIVAGTITLYRNYLKKETEYERRKIKWIFWGIYIGISPFTVFFVIPSVTGMPLIIPKEMLLAFFAVIPVAFSIAVIKYQAFDIEVIIKRSVIYSILVFIIFVIYLIFLILISVLFKEFTGDSNIALIVILLFLITLVFNPLKVRISRFVNKRFFRQQYNIELEVSRLSEEMNECLTLEQITGIISNKIKNLIPVSKIAILRILPSGNYSFLINEYYNGPDSIKDILHLFDFRIIEVKTYGQKEGTEPDLDIDFSFSDTLYNHNICLVAPLVIESKDITGLLILGNKLSGFKFGQSDMNIIKVITEHTAESINRLELQDKLLRIELEKEKLKELNILKSGFISNISNELLTPLTSIQMFTDTLLSGKVRSKTKEKEYLINISGESERLKRLIKNFLDITRIEKGIKKYNFQRINLREVVNSVINAMEYEIEKNKFNLLTKIPDNDIFINADSEAIEQIIINLISNSIKYSGEKKKIEIKLEEKESEVVLSVKDSGIGIDKPEIDKIFDTYYRTGKEEPDKSTGIGLSLVRHIINAHDARIKVDSKPGKGSTFIVNFKKDNGIINN